MKINYSRTKLTLVIGLVVAICIGGVVVYAATSTILGIGYLRRSEITNGSATFTARRLTIPSGEVGVWHYHPGIILSAVGPQTPEDINNGLTGSVTIEDGCGGSQTFEPGQGFEQIGGVCTGR